MDGGKTVVVTDAFEVPAAGGAHAVEMDPETSVYMAELMESLSRTRPAWPPPPQPRDRDERREKSTRHLDM